MKGQFIVKVGTSLLEFSDYNNEYIETFDSKLKELMKRETNAGSN